MKKSVLLLVCLFIFSFFISCVENKDKFLRTVIVNNSKKLKKIVAHSKSIVYFVYVVEKRKQGLEYYGTAFAVNRNGLLATAYHIIDGKYARDIYIVVYENGKRILKEVKRYIRYPARDIALLYIDYKFPSSATFNIKDLKSGDFLYSIGFPDSVNPLTKERANTAVISYGNFLKYKMDSVKPKFKNIRMQMSSIIIYCGASGSPVFDENGDVVGIVTHVMQGEFAFRNALSTPIKYLFNYFSSQFTKKP